MFSSFLNNYFGFNKQQRNGLFVLVLISFSLLVIRLVYPSFIKADPIVILDLPLIEKKLDDSYTSQKNSDRNSYRKKETALHLFVFDPNTVSPEQLLQLGLREKTLKVFLKFRDKGFVFKQKEDLKKVYGISDKLYAQLEPYVLIESQKPSEKNQKNEEVKIPVPTVVKAAQTQLELNTADSLSLVSLPGIGSTYAKRILKYKAVLGGYVSVEQLKEVYGLNEEVYEKIRGSFYVDIGPVKKLNLNKDDFKTINKHPYLSYELTKSIFDWRRKTSINAQNLKDILNDNSLYQKLLPYLIFD